MSRAINISISRFNEKPGDFLKKVYSPDEKALILKYMSSQEACASCGQVFDCAKMKQLQIENEGFDDGTFTWTTQDIYHVNHYDAAVSDAFLNHVKKLTAS